MTFQNNAIGHRPALKFDFTRLRTSRSQADSRSGDRRPTVAGAQPGRSASSARQEGFAAGSAAELARVLTVIRSERFAGRKSLAIELLGLNMPAEKICAALAKAPKAGGSDMLKSIASIGNPNLGAGTEQGGSKAESKASWDRTMKRLGFVKNG